MADISQLRSALTAAQGTLLSAYPQSLDVTSRAGSSSEASIGRSTGLYASLSNLEFHAAIVDAEVRKSMKLVLRRGVPVARKFAAATSVLRVYRETGMLHFIQELCCQLSATCSDFSRYSIRLRLTIFTWVCKSIKWSESVLSITSVNVSSLFGMLRDGTHGQAELITTSHSELPLQTLRDLGKPALLRALLGALRAVRATMDQAAADIHSMHRRSSPMDFYALYGTLVSSCARATLALTNQMSLDVQQFCCRPDELRSSSSHSSGSSAPPRPHLQPYIATLLDAWIETGWLSGLCAALVDMPHPDARLRKRSVPLTLPPT